MNAFEISFKRLVIKGYEVVLATSHTMLLQAANIDLAKDLFKLRAMDVNRMTGDIFQIESIKKNK